MKRYTLWAMLALAAVAVALTAHTALASPRILGERNLTNVASVGDEDYAACCNFALVTNLKAIAKLPKGGHVYQVDVTVTCSGLTRGQPTLWVVYPEDRTTGRRSVDRWK